MKIGITMGDANGIGPELILRAFQDQRLRDRCIPIIYGSSRVLNIYRKILQINKFHYSVIKNPSQAQFRRLNLIECVENLDRIEIGQPSQTGAKVAHQSLKRAIQDAQHKDIDAIITLPLDKASYQKYFDEEFTGHTELLGKAFNVEENLMLMVHENLRVGLVTNHLAIQNVSSNLSKDHIIRKAKLLHQSLLRDFAIVKPMIAILGLNPHAGDNGLVGTEEVDMINGAVQTLKDQGIQAVGPYPADGFFGAMTYRRFDGILAMYHDQGLIPFKLLAGYSGVNFTAGIPIVRTSPDHGVAYDIAGKGEADANSLRQSIYVTIDVFNKRKAHEEMSANPLKGKELKAE